MWHKAILKVWDPSRTRRARKEIEIECQSIEILLELVANELLRVYDGSGALLLGGLRGCLQVALELSTWMSSTHCGTPDVEEHQFLRAMRSSVRGVLYSGNGSLSPPTPTDRSDSSPKS